MNSKMEKYIKFNKQNNSKVIPLNPEHPFFKLLRIEIPSIPTGFSNMSLNIPKIHFTFTINNENKGSEITTINNLSSLINNANSEPRFPINKVLAWNIEHSSVEITFENRSTNDEDVILYYTIFNKIVEISDPFEDFDRHFNLNDNTKILLSGPFGQGKTTFLNHYFEERSDKYEIFRLYPVNYAVSHNEDIFKYIKVEILFQLISKTDDFEKMNFSYLETGYNYVCQNMDKLLSPFIALLPKVGETGTRIFEKLFNLSKAYEEHHKGLQIDREKDAINYINKLYEIEGSIFEDNFYSQLIRELLEQLYRKNSKKNVLIIDDIDRMDPDHIFRIFNVFSAHFDSEQFSNGYSNKFGFDKIVLICDYNNIKKIFTHRYGNETSFDGYLSKYYSRHPFPYDNKKAVEAILTKLISPSGKKIDSFIGKILLIIIGDLVNSEEITLRDLLKLLKYDFYSRIDQLQGLFSYEFNVNFGKLLYFNIFHFLESVFSIDVLIDKFRKCGLSAVKRNKVDYKHLSSLGLIPLNEKAIISDGAGSVFFSGGQYTFRIIDEQEYNLSFVYFGVDNFSPTISTIQNARFDAKDFYEILVLNAEKYKRAKASNK